MKIIKLKDLCQKDYQRIINRSFMAGENIIPEVRKIIEDIKANGDKAILQKYKKRYGRENYRSIPVSKKEIRWAYINIDNELIQALKQMIKNITSVHKAQLPKTVDTVIFPQEGISVWRVWRPIDKVGLYIPGGRAVYPSSVLMTAIPAQIVGCREIVMCSPPRIDGQIPSATLVAADMVGITKIYKVGGAEAIAAMAYGTQTIAKVYKIFGAGNAYVTAAKMLVSGKVAIDMPAGPSEVFIIADKTANPAFVAADLLADGEHGPDSACVLATTSTAIARDTLIEIERQSKNISTRKNIRSSLKRYGLIALVDDIDQAIEFANEYAPEHLEIMTKNADKLVERINNAGSIFLGDWTTKSSGDYATGANHVLPTGGTAKMYPPLGVDAFGRWVQVQRCNKRGLSRVRKTIEIMAKMEQLPAHKNATSIRFQ